MECIKEFCKSDILGENCYWIIVRSGTYGESFELIQYLVGQLRNDFTVNDKDINVVLYAGRHYANTFGVETKLELDRCQIPESYKEIDFMEYKK